MQASRACGGYVRLTVTSRYRGDSGTKKKIRAMAMTSGMMPAAIIHRHHEVSDPSSGYILISTIPVTSTATCPTVNSNVAASAHGKRDVRLQESLAHDVEDFLRVGGHDVGQDNSKTFAWLASGEY